ncbi:hypothetical protein [Halobacillus sp. A5]|uniref:hypothetical protein n=1 Tax=Halobacillus sp. A5 TaxID=2880263 RepID=UPI0020A66583|nr:hypothetical protein [Halobacillus sp. A5]MCP3026423.1 hypothetical protein [Halobacillus sp. A5]
MEKSWLSKVLPNDEYKEKRILYFIAESAVILAILLLIFALINNYSLYGNSTTGTTALLSLGFLIAYPLIRHTLSGIGYTEVTNEKRYHKEIKAIFNRSLTTLVLILITHTLMAGIPSNVTEIFDLIGPAFFISLVVFMISYISLKKSFKKNRELLDD